MTLGISNANVGGMSAGSEYKPGVQSQLSRLKMQLRNDRELWGIVVVLEAMNGSQSPLLAHELTHVAQQSSSPHVRKYAGLLLPAVQKVNG